ncbi:hypothetical protein niasHT_012932 [Heterodera trifolii]|uniref:Uncharacterized protein n=1 Tax=Heterodera trifolii TaxID=157864 RepID=A0ABD2LN11_9BILA
MGVARDFGPWALNAREFRCAGLNPRWWLARRVNQSATDGMGGVVLFCVKRRGPLPAGRPPPFRGAARTPSLPRTPSLYCCGALSDGADPPLFRGPSLAAALDPSPPFRLRGADPLSSTDPLSLLPRTPPHHSVSVGADPLSSTDPLSLLPRPPPHHSVVRRRDPPFRRPSTRTPSLPWTPSFTAALVLLRKSRCGGGGRGVGKVPLKMVSEAKFF